MGSRSANFPGKGGKGKKMPIIKRQPVMKKPAAPKTATKMSILGDILMDAEETRGMKRKQPIKSKPAAKKVRNALSQLNLHLAGH